MLKIQEYLIKNGVEKLENEFEIIVKKYDNFNVYNYSQINSPKNHPITNECRGLILANDPFYSVLCRSFDRFYNDGENGENITDISDFTILEKYDGSLINIWYNPYENKFQASTRGTAYAESKTPYGRTFNKIVNGIFDKGVEKSFLGLQKHTYIFEVVGPENRIVKIYDKPCLVLLGIRENSTGDYFTYEELSIVYKIFFKNEGNIILSKVDKFQNINSLIQTLKNYPAMEEGYVLWNEKTGYRVKMKNPGYVALHHLRDNGSINTKSITQLVFENDYEEYLLLFNCDKPFFDPYIKAHERFIEDLKDVWNSVKNIENQKEFALKVKNLPISGILFSLKRGNKLSDILNCLSLKRKVELLELYK